MTDAGLSTVQAGLAADPAMVAIVSTWSQPELRGTLQSGVPLSFAGYLQSAAWNYGGFQPDLARQLPLAFRLSGTG